MTEFTVIQGDKLDTAGSVVWWELTGFIPIDDLLDKLQGVVGNPNLPQAPSMEVALQRAAQDAARRHGNPLIRPISRRRWEAFSEKVTPGDGQGGPRVELTSLALGVVSGTKTDGDKSWVVISTSGDAGESFKADVASRIGFYSGVLSAMDVSSWLLQVAASRAVSSVPLRRHGGFYFIPRDSLQYWRAVVGAVESCSGNKIYEMPAMRTEECAMAVMASVQREAESAISEISAYLEGDLTSTRGLNSKREQVEVLTSKVAKYCAMFKASGDALFGKLDTLNGVIGAAYLVGEAAE